MNVRGRSCCEPLPLRAPKGANLTYAPFLATRVRTVSLGVAPSLIHLS